METSDYLERQASVKSGRFAAVDVLLAIGFALVALGARLIGATFSFDGDEIFSVLLASGSFEDVIERSLADKPHPPLHNVLLHLWLIPFGVSELSGRLLSALCSALSVFILFSMLRARAHLLVAACAALAVGFSSFFISYGQQARPYALISLLGALNVWAFFRVLHDPERRSNTIFWSLTGPVLLYAQYFGAIYLMVEGCILLALLRLRALRILVPAVAMSALVFPWMYTAFRSGESLDEIAWIEQPGVRSLPDFFIGVLGWPSWIHGLILMSFLLALGIGGVVMVFAHRQHQRTQEFFILAAIAFIPPILAFALSYVLGFSIWAPRQLIVSGLAFIGLLALSANALPKVPRVIASILLVMWSLAGMPDGMPSHGKPPWREIAQQIEKGQTDAMVFAQEPWAALPVSYYAPTANIKQLRPDGERGSVVGVSDLQATAYFVCRPAPPRCGQLASLSEHFGGATLVRRDRWNYVGGKPQNEITTYKLGSVYPQSE